MRIQSTMLAAAVLFAAAIYVPTRSQAAPSIGGSLTSPASELVKKAHVVRKCWWRKGKRHCRYVSHHHRWRKFYGYRPGFSFYIGPPRHGLHRGHRHHRRHK